MRCKVFQTPHIGDEGEDCAGCAEIVRTQVHRAGLRRALPVPPFVVIVAPGNGGIGEVHAQVLDSGVADEPPRSGPQAFGDHQQVGVAGAAVVERDGDVVSVIGGIDDLGAESVLGGGGALDQDARQLAAQDLQFRGGPIGSR